MDIIKIQTENAHFVELYIKVMVIALFVLIMIQIMKMINVGVMKVIHLLMDNVYDVMKIVMNVYITKR